MIDEHILVPPRWRRMLGYARIVLAAGFLAVALFSASPQNLLIQSLLVLFVVYSILAISWQHLQRAGYALLSLILDTIFLLVCATIRSPFGFWFCAAFYLYLMVTVVLYHHWKQVLLAAGIPIALFPLIRPAEAAGLVPLFAVAGALALVSSRHHELLVERLIKASRQAVLFRSESEKARQAERERIAADFHDGPQQSFISFQMRLEVLRRLLERDPEAARRELAQLQEISRSQVAEIRAFVRSMRPVEVDAAGFTAAISRLVESFEKDSGISTTFLSNSEGELKDPDLATELIQIVREALHNAQKHSGASRVAVGLEMTGRMVELSVQDDGCGFPFAGAYSLEELDLLRLGPASIKRRVRGLGGELTVESRPGHGAGIKVRVKI